MEAFEVLSLGADHRSITILDQSQLPNRMVYHTATTLEEMTEAIRSLRVRGAPAIGIYAGYCVYVLAQQLSQTCQDIMSIQKQLIHMGEVLIAARPTAVNLPWAVKRTYSPPASIIRMACATEASVSKVGTFAIDCIRTGLSPPIGVFPIWTSDDFLLV